MVPLALRYLFSDKLKLAISAGGVTFAVLLIVLILALYQGIYDRAGRLATAAPSNLWVTQAGAPDPSHGASVLPDSILDELEVVPGVEAAQPLIARSMLVGRSPNEGTQILILALPDGPLQTLTADAFGVRSLPGRGEIAIAAALAREAGVGRGDSIYVGTTAFLVAEVSPLVPAAFGGGAAFVSAEDARALFSLTDSVSFALVTLVPGADTKGVEAEIERRLPNTNALTSEAFANEIRGEVREGFLPVVAVLVGVAFVVGLAVIALTIYTSTVERIRDYGVLKAVGASPRQLFAVVMRQSLVIALIGFAAGSLLGFAAGRLIREAVPEFATLYRWQDVLAVLVAALLMSAIAAGVPIRRVAGVDPAIVFRA